MISLLVPPEYTAETQLGDASFSSQRPKILANNPLQPKENLTAAQQAHQMKRNLQRNIQNELFMKLSDEKSQTNIGVSDYIEYKNKMADINALEAADNICKTEFQKRDLELNKIKTLKPQTDFEGFVSREEKVSINKQIKRRVKEHFDYLMKKNGTKEYLFELFAPELLDDSKRFEERNAKYPKTHERINKMSIFEFRKNRCKILHSVTKNPETYRRGKEYRMGKEKRSQSYDVEIDLNRLPGPLIDPEIFLDKKEDRFKSQATRPTLMFAANLKTTEEMPQKTTEEAQQQTESSYSSPTSKRGRKSPIPMLINDQGPEVEPSNTNTEHTAPAINSLKFNKPIQKSADTSFSGKIPDLTVINKNLNLQTIAEAENKEFDAASRMFLPNLRVGSQSQSPHKILERNQAKQNNQNPNFLEKKALKLPSLSPLALARHSFKTPQKIRPEQYNKICLSPLNDLSTNNLSVNHSTLESTETKRLMKDQYRENLIRNRETERMHILEELKKIQEDQEKIQKIQEKKRAAPNIQSKSALTKNMPSRASRKESILAGRGSVFFENFSSTKVEDKIKIGNLLGKLNNVRGQMQNIFEAAETEKWKNDLILENLDETRGFLSDLNYEGKILQIIYFYKKLSNLMDKEEADKIVEQFRTGKKLPNRLAEETKRHHLMKLTAKIHSEYQKVFKENWEAELNK